MKRLIILPLFLSLVFISCKSKQNSKEIKQIDSLCIVIDSIEKKLSEIDTLNIKKVFKEYKENIEQISRYFDDQKDDSTWSTMTTYGAINKPLKNFIKIFPGLYKEIEFSRGQLDSLRSDIENNLIEGNKAAEYTKDEADAINALILQVDAYVNGTNINLKLYDSLTPGVHKLIEKLKKTNKHSTSGKDFDKMIEDD